MGRTFSMLNELERNEIIDFYKTTCSLSKTSEHFCIDRTTLHRFLREKGVMKTLSDRAAEHGRRSFRSLSEEERQNIVSRYKEGKSLKEVGIEFNVSWNSIYEYLQANNFQRKSGERKRRVVLEHEDAFSSLTPEGAYWIGFLMGDGCVHQPENPNFSPSISLVGERRDRSHLERFLRFVGSGSQSSYRKNINACQIQVYSRRLAEDLAKYGIIPRKSASTKAPSLLENDRDFWRGVVDSDGCISFVVRKKRYYYAVLELSGTVTLLSQFADYLGRQVLDKTPTVSIQDKWGTYNTNLEASPAVLAITHLYKDALVSLPRKQALADSIMDGSYKENVKVSTVPQKPHGGSKVTLEQVDEMRHLRLEGWTLKTLSAKFGVSISNIARTCTKERQSDKTIQTCSK